MELHDALHKIHFPANPDELEKARHRLKFEELFYIQLNLLRYKTNRNIRLTKPFNLIFRFVLPFEI
jgi:ATP-dependent DNA helicase RecG